MGGSRGARHPRRGGAGCHGARLLPDGHEVYPADMDSILTDPLSVDDFLAWEDRQEGRHEFDGRRISPLAGSRGHQRLQLNLARSLNIRLRPEFEVLHGMRLRVGHAVRYPDVTVCRGPIDDRTKTLSDAVAVFEVLSEDTAAIDRDDKPAEYARLPGIRHYVLLAQDRAAAEVFRLRAGAWQRQPEAADVLALPELDMRIPLTELYAGLNRAP